jgi:PncC family amidohydrolase
MDPALAELFDRAAAVAGLLVERGQTVAVVESSAGGLLSAALLSVPGASAFYLGGTVPYSLPSAQALLPLRAEEMSGFRGATAPFVECLARSIAHTLGADWAVAEAGVAGPEPNRYGDAPGQSWICVAGPGGVKAAEQLRTGSGIRRANMIAFAAGALALLERQLRT